MNTDDKKTILLVEDEAIIAMTEKMELEKYGYSVHHVTNGEKAVSAITEENLPIDLILMDIDLGSGIDGTQAAEQILKYKDIPVVFLSSHTEPEVVGKTEKITSYGYMVKNSGIVVLDASIKMAFKLFEANQKVKISDVFQNAMISNISDVIGIIDVDGVMKYKSANVEKSFGWRPEDLIGTDWWLTVHPDDFERIQKEFYTLLEKNNSSTTVEYMYKCKDGSYKPIELTATNLTNNPQIGGVLFNYHDITERKQAEESLKESKEKFKNLSLLKKAILESPEGIVVFALDKNYSYLDFTLLHKQTMKAIWGVDIEIGSNMLDYIKFKPDREKARKNFDRTLKGEKFVLYEEYGDEKLKRIFYENRYSPVYDENNNIIGLSVYVIDITEHKRVEDKLIESEKRFRKMFNNHAAIMLLIDPESGVITDANTAAQVFYGYSHQQLCALKIHEINQLLNDQVDREIQNAQNEQRNYFIFPHKLKNGQIRTVEVRSTPIEINNKKMLFSIIQDITERKQAEEALAKEKIFSEKIVETADAIIVGLDKDHIIRIFNRGAEQITGYKKEDVIGKDWFKIFFPKEILDEMNKVWKDAWGVKSYSYINQILSKTGQEKIVSWQTTGMYNSDDVSKHLLLSIGEDITERKQVEEEIKKQLAEKETLLREVHHRIKNNMANVEALLSLQADSIDNPEAKSALHDSIVRVQSIRVLYDKLLLGKEFHDISIKSYVEGLLDSISSVYVTGNEITIQKQITDFAIGSRKAISLGIIINELLTNVFKYAFTGRDKGTVTISIEKAENIVTLIIQDNGTGIDEKTNLNKSSGLGLTLVKMLVGQLGGTYSIVNENGTKSTLQFEI